MVKIFKKEILTMPKVDQKKVLTIAEVEDVSIKRFIYYLSYLNGNREDKKRRINKKLYEKEKQLAIKVDTQNL